MQEEIASLNTWSTSNKLSINFLKTTEIIFHKSHPTRFSLPPLLDNIERIDTTKFLGVNFTIFLNFNQHIDSILKVCCQRMYLLSAEKAWFISAMFDKCFSCNRYVQIIVLFCMAYEFLSNSSNTHGFEKAFLWRLCSDRYNVDDILKAE